MCGDAEPYLSNVWRKLCLSTSVKTDNDDGYIKNYIVLDTGMNTTLAFLTGDSRRIHFTRDQREKGGAVSQQ